MKKKLLPIFSYCVVFALFLSLQMGFAAPSSAHGEKIDVLISVGSEREYRYAIDIIFKNISFVYQLESIAVNSKTGERYVNSGKWLEQGGAPSPSFDVLVVNRSDTPIHSETVFFAADFYLCGADITVKCDSDNVLPAVLLEAEKKIVYELRTSAVFGIYPELSSYEGEKNISAMVKIDRADGMATDGYPFRARRQ
jgi:hypothetical protein